MAQKKKGKNPARTLLPPRKPRKAEVELAARKRAKLHVKKGDLVRVLAGKDKDREGRVLRVLKKTERAVVEGINMIKKHQKPNAKFQKGGIIDIEAPLHVSNLKVLDSAVG